ncbi:MAG: hypothetical protein AAF628_06160 [Planctomycetota bacterium]
MGFLRPSSLLLLCALAAPAQTTWIVDRAGGPGAHFSDLPPALAAAVHGDTVVLRPGSYTPGATDQGITVQGGDGVFLGHDTMRVQNVPAGEIFTMRDVDLSGLLRLGPGDPLLELSGNTGQVILEDLSIRGGIGRRLTCLHGGGLWITNCSAVSVRRCHLQYGYPPLWVTGSTAVLVECNVEGNPAWGCNPYSYSAPQSPGVITDGASVIFAGTQVRGGNGRAAHSSGWHPEFPPEPAMDLRNSAVVITGDSTTGLLAGGIPGLRRAAPTLRVRNGSLVLDPAVPLRTLWGPGSIESATVIPTVRPIPFLTAPAAVLGQSLPVDLTFRPGAAAVLMAGLASTPQLTPLGSWWLPPGLALGVGGATVPASGVLQFGLPLPNDAALEGLPLGLQAGTLEATGAQLSTPVAVVLRAG